MWFENNQGGSRTNKPNGEEQQSNNEATSSKLGDLVSITKSEGLSVGKVKPEENNVELVKNKLRNGTQSKTISLELKDSDENRTLEMDKLKCSKNEGNTSKSEHVINVMESSKSEVSESDTEEIELIYYERRDKIESKPAVLVLDSTDSGNEESDLEFNIINLKHTNIKRKRDKSKVDVIVTESQESGRKKYKHDSEKTVLIPVHSNYQNQSIPAENALKSEYVEDDRSELQFKVINVVSQKKETETSNSAPLLITMESSDDEGKEIKSDHEKIVSQSVQRAQENELIAHISPFESKDADEEESELEFAIIKLKPAKKKVGSESEPIIIATESDDDEINKIFEGITPSQKKKKSNRAVGTLDLVASEGEENELEIKVIRSESAKGNRLEPLIITMDSDDEEKNTNYKDIKLISSQTQDHKPTPSVDLLDSDDQESDLEICFLRSEKGKNKVERSKSKHVITLESNENIEKKTKTESEEIEWITVGDEELEVIATKTRRDEDKENKLDPSKINSESTNNKIQKCQPRNCLGAN